MNELQLIFDRNLIFDPILQIGRGIFDSFSDFRDKFFWKQFFCYFKSTNFASNLFPKTPENVK